MKDSLNQSLAMLVQSMRNNLGFLLILFLLTSCSLFQRKKIYYTELVCPKEIVLIRFASAKEVRRAVEDALFNKKKYESHEDYTVMRFKGNRSFVIENIAPEEAVECDIKEIPTKLRFKAYERYYH